MAGVEVCVARRPVGALAGSALAPHAAAVPGQQALSLHGDDSTHPGAHGPGLPGRHSRPRDGVPGRDGRGRGGLTSPTT